MLQVLQDQVAKCSCSVVTLIDGEQWGRQQYFVVSFQQSPGNRGKLQITEEQQLDKVCVFIPIPVEEDVDMLHLTDMVHGMERSMRSEGAGAATEVEVYAAVYEAGGSIM